MEPEIRKERISSVVADQKPHDDIFLRNFGVRTSSDMIHLNGRVLNPPKLELHVNLSFVFILTSASNLSTFRFFSYAAVLS